MEPNLIAPDVLERARRQLSEDDFKREYLGIPAGTQVSPFTFELYERATQASVHPKSGIFSDRTLLRMMSDIPKTAPPLSSEEEVRSRRI